MKRRWTIYGTLALALLVGWTWATAPPPDGTERSAWRLPLPALPAPVLYKAHLP